MAMGTAAERMARKAEIARQSRRRKKQQLQNLENTVQKLKEQLAALQKQWAEGQDENEVLQSMHKSQQAELVQKMDAKLQEMDGCNVSGSHSPRNWKPKPVEVSSSSSDANSGSSAMSLVNNNSSGRSHPVQGMSSSLMYDDLKHLVDAFAHNSNQRRALSLLYLKRLEGVLNTDRTMATLLWVLSQPPDTLTTARTATAQQLQQRLHLVPDQIVTSLLLMLLVDDGI
eukprot:TRINITY_DN66816_c8_g7_i1.p1 TRINITY_DN66816_c8_g7~~TRINITY_DN66816_c8_g7_i1.p1  ORF type:complete len:264 (+),score=128.02 TRINITY_DN66816_c8_g7_i1:110-793(+)